MTATSSQFASPVISTSPVCVGVNRIDIIIIISASFG